MNRFAYYMSGYALKAFSGISKARISTHGEEKIPKGEGSVIFTANHFTRIETVFLPYHIHEITKKPVWSLAAAELFQGGLKGVLEAMGAVSTKDPQRDFLIVKSLLNDSAQCIIFPEGMMVKNKKITSDGDFRLFGEDRLLQRPHTGAATIALQTEFYRERLKRMRSINQKEFRRLSDLYDVRAFDQIANQKTFIVPVNITYYPVRARENVLSRIALNMMENPSERVMDELMTEGTMLFEGVDVDIRFGDPILISDYFFDSFIESDLSSRRKISFSNRMCSHQVMRSKAQEIMKKYMSSVYEMTTLNYDHIMATILKYMPDWGNGIDEYDFRCRVYIATFVCEMALHVNYHSSLYASQIHFLTNDRFKRYEDFITLAVDTGVVVRKEGRLYKDDSKFDTEYTFHTVRMENPVAVIANEVEPIVKLQAYLADLAARSPSEIRLMMSYKIEDRQYNAYLDDYNRYIGTPPFPNPFHGTEILSSGNYDGRAADAEAAKEQFEKKARKTLLAKSGKVGLSETSQKEKRGILWRFNLGSSSEEEILSFQHKPFIQKYAESERKNHIYNSGRPRLLKSESDEVGILLIHDYISCPGEILPFAGYLQDSGFTVYLPRLPGHGTSPENIIESTATEWVEAAEEGIALLRSLSRKKIVGGIGLGATVALSLLERVEDVDAVFLIAPPQKIKDYPAEFITAGGIWSQLMKRAGLYSGMKADWINHLPEEDDFRYPAHPVSAIKQVEELMAQVESGIKEREKLRSKVKGREKNGNRDLSGSGKNEEADARKNSPENGEQFNIGDVPLLIVQSRSNPFINPKAAGRLFDSISSDIKEFYMFDINRHMFLRGKGRERIFSAIVGFVETFCEVKDV